MNIGNINSYATSALYSALGATNQTGSSKLLSSYIKGLTQQSSYSFDSKTLSYVTGIKTGANDLLSAARGLTGSNLFNTLASSDQEAMSVKTSSGATLGDTRLEILQVAKGQVNQGEAMDTGGKNFAAGTQRFEVELGDGKLHRFSVDVKSSDTNESVQQKIADAVNGRGIGITATVEKNSAKGTSALKLESAATGALRSNSFQIRDIGSSAIVAQSGVDNISEVAQDAKYRINSGALQTSKTNDITLAKGVTATLKKATDSVSVATGVNADHIIGKFQNLVDSYNSLLKTTDGNDAAGARRLASNLTSLYSAYGTSLNAIGITMGKDGFLGIDESKMKSAANDGTLSRFISGTEGKNFGFTSQLERVATQVKNNTAQYTAAANPYNTTYSGWLNAKSASHTEALGLLLNYTI